MMKDTGQVIIETPEKILFTYDLADIGTRIAAYVVDILIQALIFLGIVYFLILPFAMSGFKTWWLLLTFLSLLLFFVKWFYFTAFETLMEGQTPGKKMMRIRVIKCDGEALNIESIIMRNFLRVVDEFPGVPLIGGLMTLIDKKRRRLGDLVADTIVVYEIEFNLKIPDFSVQFQEKTKGHEKRVMKKKLTEKQLYIIRRFLNSRKELQPNKEKDVALALAENVRKELSLEETIEDPIKFLEGVYKDHGV